MSKITFTSSVKQVTVVQKPAGVNNEVEPWLRVVLEYPLDKPAVLTEIGTLRGDAVVVELTGPQLARTL